jgi:hypothetical protein
MGFETFAYESNYDSSKQARKVNVKLGHSALFGKDDKI